MTSMDSHNSSENRNAFNFQTINSDTTTDGVIIDTQNFEDIEFLAQVGTVSAGDVTLLIQDGDDPSLADAADVIDDFLLGTEALTKLDTANTVSRIGYNGKKRFVRASAVTDNSANLQVGVQALLGSPRTAPISQ